MRNPMTADERERRFVRYVKGLNKGEIAELRFAQLNHMANFRKDLIKLLEEMIEVRAQEIAAGMLMETAADRPRLERRLAIVRESLKLQPK